MRLTLGCRWYFAIQLITHHPPPSGHHPSSTAVLMTFGIPASLKLVGFCGLRQHHCSTDGYSNADTTARPSRSRHHHADRVQVAAA